MRIDRSPDPGPFNNYRDYKLHLQRLFRCRCAYCLSHENAMGRYDAMEVDHFRPKGRPEFAHLEHKWENLYYCCRRCNQHKWNHWPTDQEKARGLRFVDPCAEDPDDHLRLCRQARRSDLCWVTSSTDPGRYTIEKIRLNRRQLVDIRRSIVAAERDEQAHLSRIAQSIASLTDDVECRGPSAQTEQAMRNLKEEQQRCSERLAEIRSLFPFRVDERS